MFKRKRRWTLYDDLVVEQRCKDIDDALAEMRAIRGDIHVIELGTVFIGTKKEAKAYEEAINNKAIVNLYVSGKTKHLKGGE